MDAAIITPPGNPAPAKRRHYALWLLLCVFVVALAVLISALRTAPAQSGAIVISFLGFTNISPSPHLFALLAVSNRAGYTIRWRGLNVELEGSPGYRAIIENRKAPGYTWSGGKIIKTNVPMTEFDPTLKPGESLSLIIGEPDPDRRKPLPRWRLSMFFSRYTLSQRYYDIAMKHHLPLKLGPVLLVDDQKFLNPSNHVIASSPWLSK